MIHRLLCWWRGHDFHLDYDGYLCPYCRRTFDYNAAMEEPLAARTRLSLWWREKVVEWWRCPYCDGRLGRHDEEVEHPPF